MVVIWPDNNIPNDVLAKFQKQLAPFYLYEDCRALVPKPGDPHAGVVIYHPEPRISN